MRPNQRSYVLQTTIGGVFLRNRRFIKPRVSGEQDGGDEDQADDQGEEEESQEDREVSSISGVSTSQEPVGTAGQERALMEQESRRVEAGVRGRLQAGEKARFQAAAAARPANPQPEPGPEERRSYKQALCDPPVRMTTRSMARQNQA